MIKRISAMALAIVMTACAFTGCAKKSNNGKTADSSVSDTSSSDSSSADSASAVPEPSLTIDGKKIDTTNFVVCTIDGVDIDFDTFRYYYFSSLNMFMQNYGVDINTINATEGGFDALKGQTIDTLKQKILWKKLAQENKLELTDDEKKTAVDDQLSSLKSNYSSDEEYKSGLKSAYLTEETYKDLLLTQAYYTKVSENLFSNDEKYATKKEDFKKIVKEPDARIGHSDMPDVGVLREKAFEGSHNPDRVVGLDKNRVDNAIRKILFDIVYESVTACSIRVSLVS